MISINNTYEFIVNSTLLNWPNHPAQWEAQMRLTLDTNLVYKVNTIVYTWN